MEFTDTKLIIFISQLSLSVSAYLLIYTSHVSSFYDCKLLGLPVVLYECETCSVT
jgi:hypothetical protein